MHENTMKERIRFSVISEVLEQFGMQTQLTVEDDVQFVTRFDMYLYLLNCLRWLF